MDIGFTQEQKMLKQAARDFLAKEAPMAHVRAMQETATGYDPALWKKLAALGWLALPFSSDTGGSEGSLVDLVALYEEFGRALLPGPHLETVAIAGGLIQSAGTKAQRRRLLPSIGEGAMTITPLLAKPGAAPGAKAIGITARKSTKGWVLNGTAGMVTYAKSVDCYLALGKAGAQIGLFLIDAKARGITVAEQPNITGERLFNVSLKNVAVDAGALIGKAGLPWAEVNAVLQRAAVLRCAQMAGATHKALEMAAEYAKTRVQFGQPIGKFQGVQWLIADAAVAAHTASLMTYQAAWAIDTGVPCQREVAMAKAYASTAARDGIRAAHEVFAGVAFIAEHDMHLYARHAKFWEMSLGEVRHFKELAAQAMGL